MKSKAHLVLSFLSPFVAFGAIEFRGFMAVSQSNWFVLGDGETGVTLDVAVPEMRTSEYRVLLRVAEVTRNKAPEPTWGLLTDCAGAGSEPNPGAAHL